MRNRVAIAIAKREREKLGKVEVRPATKAKKATKKAKAEVVPPVEAPVVPEAPVEEMIAEDPQTLEEPGG